MQLLENYYIDYKSNNKTKTYILALLHELRVLTSKQILALCQLKFSISFRTIQHQLQLLQKENYVGKSQDNKIILQPYYYLTKTGHQFFGGIYTFPKVPEYNLLHHLTLTNCLITTLELTREKSNFSIAQSERRQVFEIKDGTNTRGKKYNVSDYMFRFVGKHNLEIDWHFEVELSLKSRQRYTKSVMPKYFDMLIKEPANHVFYISPNDYILKELSEIKSWYTHKLKIQEMNRLHIFSLQNFQSEIKSIIDTDSHINFNNTN